VVEGSYYDLRRMGMLRVSVLMLLFTSHATELHVNAAAAAAAAAAAEDAHANAPAAPEGPPPTTPPPTEAAAAESAAAAELAAAAAVCPVEVVKQNNTITTYTSMVPVVSALEAMSIVKESKQPYVVLLVYAKWCPFSAKVDQTFSMVAGSFPTHSALFIKVDGYNDKRFGTHLVIRGYPTIMIFGSGKPVSLFEGPKTRKHITDFIQANTNVTSRTLRLKSQAATAMFETPVRGVDWMLRFSLFYVCLTGVFASFKYYMQQT